MLTAKGNHFHIHSLRCLLYTSQETFDRIMGGTKYGLIGIQLDSNATEETIAEIRSLENDDIIITCLLYTSRGV